MKIRPVGAELFHADRRTDMIQLIVAFRYFSNASKIQSVPRCKHMPPSLSIHIC